MDLKAEILQYSKWTEIYFTLTKHFDNIVVVKLEVDPSLIQFSSIESIASKTKSHP